MLNVMMNITREEYEQLRKIVEPSLAQKAKQDAELEEKEFNSYAGMPAIGLCKVTHLVPGVRIFELRGFYFDKMIDALYYDAINNHDEMFGTRNATDILKALYHEDPYSDCIDGFGRKGLESEVYGLDAFAERLSQDNFCLYVKEINGKLSKEILRIDLFRHYKKESEHSTRYAFTGGLFHIFKHFSIEGKPMSILKENINIPTIHYLLKLAVLGFWKEERIPDLNHKQGNSYSIVKDTIINSSIMVNYYTDENSRISFVNSMRKANEKDIKKYKFEVAAIKG